MTDAERIAKIRWEMQRLFEIMDRRLAAVDEEIATLRTISGGFAGIVERLTRAPEAAPKPGDTPRTDGAD